MSLKIERLSEMAQMAQSLVNRADRMLLADTRHLHRDSRLRRCSTRSIPGNQGPTLRNPRVRLRISCICFCMRSCICFPLLASGLKWILNAWASNQSARGGPSCRAATEEPWLQLGRDEIRDHGRRLAGHRPRLERCEQLAGTSTFRSFEAIGSGEGAGLSRSGSERSTGRRGGWGWRRVSSWPGNWPRVR